MAVELSAAGGVALWLAVVAGWLAGGSMAADEVLGSGVDGIVAIAPAVLASELCVEGDAVGADSAFAFGGVLATEPCVSTLALDFGAGDRAAGSRLERPEVLPLAALLDGVFAVGTLSSAGVVVVAALRAGACVAAALPADAAASAAGVEGLGGVRLASATIAGRAADGDAVFSELFTL